MNLVETRTGGKSVYMEVDSDQLDGGGYVVYGNDDDDGAAAA